MDKPRWLDDEMEIRQLLRRLVDMLDTQPLVERKQPLRVKLNKKLLPELFRYDVQSDHEWAMLKSLSDQHALFEIKHSRKSSPFDAEFANASLVLNPQAEPMLREWLGRPVQVAYGRQWQDAVKNHASIFSDQGKSLIERPTRIKGKSAEHIVAGFAELAHAIDKGLSLRQLSARCFWGHSKFLDSREELLNSLFTNANIRPRPIIINVCLPDMIKGVLFIENQDSYLNAITPNKDASQAINYDQLALVYLSGFQGGAKRIRNIEGAGLHFHSQSKPDEKMRFEAWWFENNNANWPCFFWGDLDFSGMGILKTLRQRFANTEAWQPGYNMMLAQINTGKGHDATLAGKEEQRDPGQTGCPYADNILLPALRQMALFMDQEWA